MYTHTKVAAVTIACVLISVQSVSILTVAEVTTNSVVTSLRAVICISLALINIWRDIHNCREGIYPGPY